MLYITDKLVLCFLLSTLNNKHTKEKDSTPNKSHFVRIKTTTLKGTRIVSSMKLSKSLPNHVLDIQLGRHTSRQGKLNEGHKNSWTAVFIYFFLSTP